MSVNISALQFIRSDLDAIVKQVLADTGLDPSLLCLELTESMIMTDNDRTMAILTRLKETGIILSLDDFGTGYSSLEYLGRLPIDELKIDRSFVQRMLTTKNNAVVVSTIISMAQSLEMELVAEGVETEEELNYLLEKQCHTIQGFYYSKPLSPNELVQFSRNWNRVTLKHEGFPRRNGLISPSRFQSSWLDGLVEPPKKLVPRLSLLKRASQIAIAYRLKHSLAEPCR